MTARRLIAVLLFVLLSSGPALAVLQPAEMLEDPALEARARELSQQLRCLVCQNQSIDDSDAELARDLRVLVREKIAAGASDEEVLDYVVSRYGEFVLLRPRFNLRNAALWLAPLLILAAGGFYLARSARRTGAASGGALSAEEEEALRRALGERGQGSRQDY